MLMGVDLATEMLSEMRLLISTKKIVNAGYLRIWQIWWIKDAIHHITDLTSHHWIMRKLNLLAMLDGTVI